MPVSAKEIEEALMPTKPKKKGNEDAYKKWQDEAKENYKKLNQLGVAIVNDFFKSNPTGICGSAPWGSLGEGKNPYHAEWATFKSKCLNTEQLKEKDSVKQVRLAIYMGSQQIWLDNVSKNDSQFTKAIEHLTYQMKARLTLLKNKLLTETTDFSQKKNFLMEFFTDTTQKKSLPAFVQALNLNYWANKKCRPLLKKLKALEAKVAVLRRTPLKEREEWTLPAKPTIDAVAKAIRSGMVVELVGQPEYETFYANSGNFAKLIKEDRQELESLLAPWVNAFKSVDNIVDRIEMLHMMVKASTLMK